MLCDSAMNAHKNFTEAVSAYSNLATIYTLNNSLDTAKCISKNVLTSPEEENSDIWEESTWIAPHFY
ncbi:MAG: hypothetical protein IPG39_18830 [Bacteroidetes bacterium]|nr:hypothetical protein [Bacteroidota bacterium]